MLLFGIMAIEIKRKAPHAHTVCEIVKARSVKHLINFLYVMNSAPDFHRRKEAQTSVLFFYDHSGLVFRPLVY